MSSGRRGLGDQWGIHFLAEALGAGGSDDEASEIARKVSLVLAVASPFHGSLGQPAPLGLWGMFYYKYKKEPRIVLWLSFRLLYITDLQACIRILKQLHASAWRFYTLSSKCSTGAYTHTQYIAYESMHAKPMCI